MQNSPDFIDLSEELRGLDRRKNEIGRYSVSIVHDIITGKLTPEKYLNHIPAPLKIIWNNFELGTAKHKIIERLLLDFITELKKEITITDGVILVGKFDLCKNGILYELKTSNQLKFCLNDWNITQGKLYCSIFDMPKCIFYQPVFKGRKFGLKKFGEVKKDDEWFEFAKEKIIEFHKKVATLQI